jgi:hypothetical protein
MFKICTGCRHEWLDRESLLTDPCVDLVGYQVDFVDLDSGFFLFTHSVCGTSFGIGVFAFRDLYRGPVFTERATGSDSCPGHCLRKGDLDPCPVQCECAYVRDILQCIREWPKSA